MFAKKGVVLITTLIFVSLIVMFSVLVAQQGKRSIENGVGLSDAEQAYMAALSGIDFARANVFHSKSWGCGSGLGSDVSDAVNSNVRFLFGGSWVKGYLGYRPDGGYDSMFSISFAASPSDPQICRYPSCNNIMGDAVISADAANKYHRDVPAGAFYIVSRGASGKAVKYVEAVFVSAGPSVLGGGTTIGGDIKVKGVDSSEIANLKADGQLDDGFEYSGDNPLFNILRVDRKGALNVMSPGSMTAFRGGGSGSGKVSIESSAIASSKRNNLLNISDESELSRKVTITSPELYLGGSRYDPDNEASRLNGLNYVEKNETFDTSDMDQSYEAATAGITAGRELLSGTYVFVKDCDDASGSRWLYLSSVPNLDGDYDDRASSVINALKTDETLHSAKGNESVSFGGSGGNNRTVVVSDSLKVKGDVNFIVVEKVKAQESGGGSAETEYVYRKSPDTVDFSIKSSKNGSVVGSESSADSDPAILCDGSLVVDGEVTGSGKIFSKKNVSFNSGSSLETKPQSGVAVWASGDVNVKSAAGVSEETLDSKEGMDALLAATNRELAKEGKAGKDPASAVDKFRQEQNGTGSSSSGSGDVGDFEPGLEIALKPGTGSETTIKLPDGYFFYGGSSGDYEPLSQIDFKQKHTSGDAITGTYETFINLGGGWEKQNTIKILSMTSGTPEEAYTFQIIPLTYEYESMVGGNEGYSSSNFRLTIFKNNSIVSQADFEADGVSQSVKGPGGVPTSFNLTQGTSPFNMTVSGNQYNKQGVPPDTMGEGELSRDESVRIVRKAIRSASTELKGTVYSAGGDIRINGGKSNFDIRGALVTMRGDLNIEDILTATLLYDPDYVPFFLDKGVILSSVFMRAF